MLWHKKKKKKKKKREIEFRLFQLRNKQIELIKLLWHIIYMAIVSHIQCLVHITSFSRFVTTCYAIIDVSIALTMLIANNFANHRPVGFETGNCYMIKKNINTKTYSQSHFSFFIYIHLILANKTSTGLVKDMSFHLKEIVFHIHPSPASASEGYVNNWTVIIVILSSNLCFSNSASVSFWNVHAPEGAIYPIFLF